MRAIKSTNCCASNWLSFLCCITLASQRACCSLAIVSAIINMFKDRCDRLCEHGDAAYLSDNDPLAYDGSECHCKKCPNFNVCHTWTPDEMCPICQSTYNQVLIAETTGNCPICTDEKTLLYKHPGCKHHLLCGTCLHALFVEGRRPEQPKPSEYGFVRTCNCEDGDAEWGTHQCDVCAKELQEWENTEMGFLWIEACTDSIDETTPTSACPFCRTDFISK